MKGNQADTIVFVLALLGIVACAVGAFLDNARVVGVGGALIGIAVLLT